MSAYLPAYLTAEINALSHVRPDFNTKTSVLGSATSTTVKIRS
jgi:hypothetical protein